MSGTGVVVGKRQTEDFGKGTRPFLARRTGAAGRGGKRILTGDVENLMRVIGKSHPGASDVQAMILARRGAKQAPKRTWGDGVKNVVPGGRLKGDVGKGAKRDVTVGVLSGMAGGALIGEAHGVKRGIRHGEKAGFSEGLRAGEEQQKWERLPLAEKQRRELAARKAIAETVASRKTTTSKRQVKNGERVQVNGRWVTITSHNRSEIERHLDYASQATQLARGEIKELEVPDYRRAKAKADGRFKRSYVARGATNDSKATQLHLEPRSKHQRRLERISTGGAGVAAGASAGRWVGRLFGRSSLGALGGAGIGGTAFMITPSTHHLRYQQPDGLVTAGKSRNYDPDSRRSARTGAAAGVTGVAGAGLGLYGLRDVYVNGNPTRNLPSYNPGKEPVRQTEFRYQGGAHHGKPRKPLDGELDAAERRYQSKATAYAERKKLADALDAAKKTKGRFVTRRGAAAVVGGAALGGASAGLHRRAKEPRYL